MTDITACIICKNEEKHIVNCLQALKHFGISVVVTDTGSTDKTTELARSVLTDKDILTDFKWCDDFSAARNYCASLAGSDWIWAIDADEVVTAFDETYFSAFIRENGHTSTVGTVSQTDVFESADTFEQQAITQLGRIYNKTKCHYEGKIHEQISPIADGEPLCYKKTGISIEHYGYFDKNDLHQKCRRNIQLLNKELSELPPNEQIQAPYLYYQLGKAHSILKEYPEAIRYLQQGLSYDLEPKLAYVASMVEAYGYALLETKQYTTALSFTEIYDAFSYRCDFVFLMALIYMNNGYFENAISEFKKATTYKDSEITGVNTYLSNYNIGVIYECMGNKNLAISYYLKCKDYAPAVHRLSELGGTPK